MSEHIEKRGFTRVPLPFPARVLYKSSVLECDQGMDVSARGISVQTEKRPKEGTLCTVEILLGEALMITAKGMVARHSDTGFAVEFHEIGRESFELLKDLVRFNADDPDAVDREFCQHLGLASG